MKVLAIGAHPDDIEIICAGTMIKYSMQGDEVFICHACDGSKGSKTHTSEEIAKIRRFEAIESASIIGAKSLTAGIPDGEVVLDLNCRLKIVDVIRQADPDLIITHHPGDYMTDHINVSRLVFEATYLASLKLLKTNYEPSTKLPYLYYMDTLGGINFAPADFVDITDTIDTKISMMMKMKSQIGWLKDMHDCDIEEYIKVVARYRGFQAAVFYAEGFIQAQLYPQGLTKRILP